MEGYRGVVCATDSHMDKKNTYILKCVTYISIMTIKIKVRQSFPGLVFHGLQAATILFIF